MDRLVWVCVAYTAATFTVDLIDSCWFAGEILYDIYKQRRKQAEKVSRKKEKEKHRIFSRIRCFAYRQPRFQVCRME